MINNHENYWNSYYVNKLNSSIPSQFAAFVLNEFSTKKRFIDIGCGDGRDSFFFADHGMSVLGVDGSSSAIGSCEQKATSKCLSNATFQCLQMNNAMECDNFVLINKNLWAGSLLYSRFFLHAIDDETERNFLKLASELAGQEGSVCLEFRTPRDQFQQKETGEHYRRYVDPLGFIERARKYNFECKYVVEGFGFAKYKSDDAYVARIILTKG